MPLVGESLSINVASVVFTPKSKTRQTLNGHGGFFVAG
jgi:hypothetical protein